MNIFVPVPDIDPDPLDDEVDQLVDLDIEVGPVIDDVDVGVVPPRLHGLAVTLTGQLQAFKPQRK